MRKQVKESTAGDGGLVAGRTGVGVHQPRRIHHRCHARWQLEVTIHLTLES